MGNDSVEQVRQVPRNMAENTNMFCFTSELNFDIVNRNRVTELGQVNF